MIRKEEWLRVLDSIKYLMDFWEDNKSVEIYTSDIIDEALVGKETIKKWNNEFVDEIGLTWCLHLYAYVENTNIRYEGVLYDNVEKGTSWDVDINIEPELKKALDEKVMKFVTKKDKEL